MQPSPVFPPAFLNRYVFSGAAVFCISWLLLFVLYLPAAHAGLVGDFPGWVTFLNSVGFIDYINRKGSGIASMYQFTQIVTYFFYLLFHAHAWPWHLLYITLQATNTLLLYILLTTLFQRAQISSGKQIALCTGLLFCASPYLSEVVVWESSFHYLLALLLMLATLIFVQQYLLSGNIRYVWYAAVVFFLSSFSLEIFYLTPAFVCTLIIYHSLTGAEVHGRMWRTISLFLLPQVIILALHFALLRILYHTGLAHIGGDTVGLDALNLSKPLKYLFHLVLLGRFYAGPLRDKCYHICESPVTLLAFYTLVSAAIILPLLNFKKRSAYNRALYLLFIWLLLSLGLLIPLWFPQAGLVIQDRYAYVALPFLFAVVSMLIFKFNKTYIRYLLAATLMLANIRYTHRANAFWQQSAQVVDNLVRTFPNDPEKTVVLLNLPDCLQGVQMIGANPDGELKKMYNVIMPTKITNTVYDVEAYYMSGTGDGAHAMVINDSTAIVTLNQWGTWWLYNGFGGTSYENDDYKVDMKDAGHYYQITLKKDPQRYLLLYQTGDHWKKLDWNKKSVDQY